jgi:hypothetical protein
LYDDRTFADKYVVVENDKEHKKHSLSQIIYTIRYFALKRKDEGDPTKSKKAKEKYEGDITGTIFKIRDLLKQLGETDGLSTEYVGNIEDLETSEAIKMSFLTHLFELYRGEIKRGVLEDIVERVKEIYKETLIEFNGNFDEGDRSKFIELRNLEMICRAAETELGTRKLLKNRKKYVEEIEKVVADGKKRQSFDNELVGGSKEFGFNEKISIVNLRQGDIAFYKEHDEHKDKLETIYGNIGKIDNNPPQGVVETLFVERFKSGGSDKEYISVQIILPNVAQPDNRLVVFGSKLESHAKAVGDVLYNNLYNILYRLDFVYSKPRELISEISGVNGLKTRTEAELNKIKADVIGKILKLYSKDSKTTPSDEYLKNLLAVYDNDAKQRPELKEYAGIIREVIIGELRERKMERARVQGQAAAHSRSSQPATSSSLLFSDSDRTPLHSRSSQPEKPSQPATSLSSTKSSLSEKPSPPIKSSSEQSSIKSSSEHSRELPPQRPVSRSSDSQDTSLQSEMNKDNESNQLEDSQSDKIVKTRQKKIVEERYKAKLRVRDYDGGMMGDGVGITSSEKSNTAGRVQVLLYASKCDSDKLVIYVLNTSQQIKEISSHNASVILGKKIGGKDSFFTTITVDAIVGVFTRLGEFFGVDQNQLKVEGIDVDAVKPESKTLQKIRKKLLNRMLHSIIKARIAEPKNYSDIIKFLKELEARLGELSCEDSDKKRAVGNQTQKSELVKIVTCKRKELKREEKKSLRQKKQKIKSSSDDSFVCRYNVTVSPISRLIFESKRSGMVSINVGSKMDVRVVLHVDTDCGNLGVYVKNFNKLESETEVARTSSSSCHLHAFEVLSCSKTKSSEVTTDDIIGVFTKLDGFFRVKQKQLTTEGIDVDAVKPEGETLHKIRKKLLSRILKFIIKYKRKKGLSDEGSQKKIVEFLEELVTKIDKIEDGKVGGSNKKRELIEIVEMKRNKFLTDVNERINAADDLFSGRTSAANDPSTPTLPD